MRAKFLKSFDKAKIYYEKSEADKNKWLVFLHGFGGDLGAWEKEIEYFTNLGYSTLALDLRGHGLSSKSDDIDFYKLENFAKDLKLIIDAEKIKRPVILGHCFGGMVTSYFQAKFPKISKALILIDTSFKPPFISPFGVQEVFLKHIFDLLATISPNTGSYSHADFNQFIGTADIDLARIFSDISHTSLKSYLLLCEQLSGFDLRKLFSKINVPTLIIQGSEDSIYPMEIAKYLHSRIKKSELDIIEGANHILVLNNPSELEQSIQSFLMKINF